MARVCQLSKTGTMAGNNVSHSNRKTKRKFRANVQWHRIFDPSTKRFVRMRLSSKGLQLLDKFGAEYAIKMLKGNV